MHKIEKARGITDLRKIFYVKIGLSLRYLSVRARPVVTVYIL